MTEEANPPPADEEAVEQSQGEEPAAQTERDSGSDLDAILESEAPIAVVGEGLSESEAEALCAEERCTVVVLAGGVRSGKTTLLTSIYEQLNQQPFGPDFFAGSGTLFGFENRVHGWREYSGESTPMTERTGLTQPPWLHLRLRDPASGYSHRLLMADLSGEHFERLVVGERGPESLPMLSRADHLALVLNGRKLADARERLIERSRAEQLLRILSAPGVLASVGALTIVVAKLDEYLADGRADDLEEFALRLQQNAGVTGGLPLFRTAAQPHSSKYPLGHGVDALLGYWLLDDERTEPAELASSSAETAYGRFGLQWSDDG